MGGIGSGWHIGTTSITDNFLRLDVRHWQREGLLAPGRSFSTHWKRHGEEMASIGVRTEAGRVILSYRQRSGGGDWQDMEYPVYLDYSACNYGGTRAWFLCPARGCGQRVAILYGGAIFACRHCHRLTYASQGETPFDRKLRRANKIRGRLGWRAGIINPIGDKPKGMHWRTFERLTAKHDDLTMQSLAGIMRQLNIKI